LDKVNENTKKLLSRKEVMETMAEVTARTIEACFEEKDKGIATIRAGLEGYRLIEKLFPEEPAENPELSALKELLFERTHLAKEKYDNEHMDLQFSRYTGLYALIKDAGLKEEYDDWKEEKGYE
jgi:hypothetical protein